MEVVLFGGELFNSSGITYWLASRCVWDKDDYAIYFLRRVTENGTLSARSMVDSKGEDRGDRVDYLRVVVSLPASRVNVANDGTVTIE